MNVEDRRILKSDLVHKIRKQTKREVQRATDMILVKKFVKSGTLMEIVSKTMKNKISPDNWRFVE